MERRNGRLYASRKKKKVYLTSTSSDECARVVRNRHLLIWLLSYRTLCGHRCWRWASVKFVAAITAAVTTLAQGCVAMTHYQQLIIGDLRAGHSCTKEFDGFTISFIVPCSVFPWLSNACSFHIRRHFVQSLLSQKNSFRRVQCTINEVHYVQQVDFQVGSPPWRPEAQSFPTMSCSSMCQWYEVSKLVNTSVSNFCRLDVRNHSALALG